jgi:hypothetical protein
LVEAPAGGDRGVLLGADAGGSRPEIGLDGIDRRQLDEREGHGRHGGEQEDEPGELSQDERERAASSPPLAGRGRGWGSSA